MSAKSLRKAARIKDPRMDLEHRITLMLIADRADNRGHYAPDDDDAFHAALAEETTSVLARLRGDEFVRPWVDNARITRVIDALKEADEG